MADATLQILGLGQGFVPLGYNVTGDQSMDLLAVKADFDGTTAGTDFVPMVQIISPANEIMAESQGDTVAAGGSATVTFAPFLRAAATGGAAFTSQYAQYTAGILSLAPAGVGNLELAGPSTGPSLLDISVPGTPTVVAAGTYAFSCDFRIVLIFGTPTSGQTSQYAISALSGAVTAQATWLQPTAGGGFLPQVSATTVPVDLAAGDAVTFVCTNHDTTKTLRYDSPVIGVAKLG